MTLEEALTEIARLKTVLASHDAAHQAFKDRVYELLELEQKYPGPYTCLEIVEFKREAWAKWQGWKGE